MHEDKIRMMFKLMEWDQLTDDQHKLVISYEKQFDEKGSLSVKQAETLESIFEQAASKIEWSRW